MNSCSVFLAEDFYIAVRSWLQLLEDSLELVWVWLGLLAFIQNQLCYGCRVAHWWAPCRVQGNRASQSWEPSTRSACSQLSPRLASLAKTPAESQQTTSVSSEAAHNSNVPGLTNLAGVTWREPGGVFLHLWHSQPTAWKKQHMGSR